MGNRDPSANARGPEILAPLQHLEQHPLVLLVQPEQSNEFGQDLVLGGAGEVEFDRFF